MADENVISLENVCKTFKFKRVKSKKEDHKIPTSKERYGKNIVLDKISLKVKKGETVGIIGRNGSGKSTLLKVISRILEPDSGTIDINGKIASILELGMGFHQDMSGRENIFIKGSMYGFSKKEVAERVDKIIEYSGIGGQIDDPLRTYSSGMSARLAFSIMINVDAEILIIDEILSTGDASFSAKASQHFKRAAKSGKTILFVSHSIGSVIEMCDRTIWIDDGKIREDGDTKTVCDHYKKEIVDSFEITKEFAESGVVDAQYRLAHMYLDGDKTDRDPVEASKWMWVAAEQNNSNAVFEYGDMLFEGVGIEKDVQAAIAYYQKAADLGNNDAAIKVAMLTNNEDDKKTLINLFKQLAENGSPDTMFYFAQLLLKTGITTEDKENAFAWFNKAANGGHMGAKYEVAIMYGRGIGVKKNIQQHISLLEDVANLGHAKAQFMLFEIFSQGIIIEADERRAFQWCLKSAESGNPKSQYRIAVMYRDGIGVDTDLELSKKWFKIFSTSSMLKYWSKVGDALNNIELDTSLTPHDVYKKMAESFDHKSMLKLGKYYRNQNTIEGMNEAIEWLQMAAERQNVTAQLLLGNIYSQGKIIKKDVSKAIEYYLAAAVAGNLRASQEIVTKYSNHKKNE